MAVTGDPPGNTVTIESSGPVTETWHLVSSEQGWEFSAVPGPLVATMAMSTDEAWRLLTNILSPERQVALRTSGDPVVVDVLRSTRSILGIPK
jgi:hypothetical protein